MPVIIFILEFTSLTRIESLGFVMCRKFWTFVWTKIPKNLLFRRIFFSSSEKLTFKKENVIFFQISFIWKFGNRGTWFCGQSVSGSAWFIFGVRKRWTDKDCVHLLIRILMTFFLSSFTRTRTIVLNVTVHTFFILQRILIRNFYLLFLVAACFLNIFSLNIVA